MAERFQKRELNGRYRKIVRLVDMGQARSEKSHLVVALPAPFSPGRFRCWLSPSVDDAAESCDTCACSGFRGRGRRT